MSPLPPVRVRKHRVAFRGRSLTVTVDEVQVGPAQPRIREVAHHSASVVMLARDERGRVAMVRQYRHGAARRLWELPAGGVEPGESPLAAARRELLEETGLTARRWRQLGRYYPSPGILDELMYVYLAQELTAGAAQPEPYELITCRFFDFGQLSKSVAAGRVEDGKTLAAWALLMARDPAGK